MSALTRRWRAVATVVALATAASAAPTLTTIQDVLYKADGSRFNGTVTIAWNNFQAGDNTPVPVQATTVTIVNGNLNVRLIPTTNASAGANYAVTYASQGKYQFTETWAVPPTTNTLRVRDVRVATGTVVGPPPPLITQLLISDVSGLTNELNGRPIRGTGFAPSRGAVINSAGQIDGAGGNLGDCVHVDGTSGPCGSAAGTGGAPSIGFADAETPAGLVNGVNTSFALNYTPNPAASLLVFRNGILMKQGFDYTVANKTISFFTLAAPQAGDLLTVSYRYTPSN